MIQKSCMWWFRNPACGGSIGSNNIEKDQIHVRPGLVWGKEAEYISLKMIIFKKIKIKTADVIIEEKRLENKHNVNWNYAVELKQLGFNKISVDKTRRSTYTTNNFINQTVSVNILFRYRIEIKYRKIK